MEMNNCKLICGPGKIWKKLARLRDKLYTLQIPGGPLAKQFISLYNNASNSFTNGEKK